MKISTTAQYETLTAALLDAGYTTETVYAALEDSGFSVDLGDELYEGVYVSRVIAMMHNSAKPKAKPLKLKLK